MVSRDPEAVTICCSFVPANWPKIACVIADGGCIVSEYMNIDDVVAILSVLADQRPQRVRMSCWGRVNASFHEPHPPARKRSPEPRLEHLGKILERTGYDADAADAAGRRLCQCHIYTRKIAYL